MINKLGIAVCARNERHTIVSTLDSILVAVKNCQELEWQLVVCTNGSSDSTPNLVASWIANNSNLPVAALNLQFPDLVEAQRACVDYLKQNGATQYLFFDADIIVHPGCVAALHSAAQEDGIHAVYAQSIPVKQGKPTFVEICFNLYDSDKCIYSSRKHLHGRAFLLKQWDIPEKKPKLLADDIYISCAILKEHGDGSIKAVPDAKVYFHQLTSVRDAYHAYARRKQEFDKCMRHFPLFKMLPPDQLNRRLLWAQFFAQSRNDQLIWLCFLSLRQLFRVTHTLAKFFGCADQAVWIETASTKRPHCDRS